MWKTHEMEEDKEEYFIRHAKYTITLSTTSPEETQKPDRQWLTTTSSPSRLLPYKTEKNLHVRPSISEVNFGLRAEKVHLYAGKWQESARVAKVALN